MKKSLYQALAEQGKLEGKARSTIATYMGVAKRLDETFGLPFEQLTAEQLRMYLVLRVDVDEASLSMLKIEVAGIKYLYTKVLRQPDKADRIPWPRVPFNLPEVLSPAEIDRFCRIAMAWSRF